MQLTLLIPELIWPEPDDRDTFDGLASPMLNTLLSRSRLQRHLPQSLEATLTDAFGFPEGAPYAALRLLGESNLQFEAGQNFWLCCDPVHLRFHQELLVVADSGSFDLYQDEAQALVEALNKNLPDIGRFHVASSGRWYLQLAENIILDNFDAPPLSTIAGRSIEQLLPETAQALVLRKFLNEAQMLLHSHPINQQRERAGRMPINSLWLWGAGKQPERREADFDGVWSINPLALGLARAAGVPTHQLPAKAEILFEHAAAETHHLVVLEDLITAVQYENGEAYCAALNNLEIDWFAPLRTALASGRITKLRLEASTAYGALTWESNRHEQWKFWRNAQPLAMIAQELAKSSL